MLIFVFSFYVISILLVDIDHLLFDYRFLNEKLVEVESKAQQLQRQEERITELESELSVYSENHRMISEQLRESEMKKHELDQQVSIEYGCARGWVIMDANSLV